MNWSELTAWWSQEVVADPAYEDVVTPLLFEVFHPAPGGIYLDLGCGEGRVMRSVRERGADVHGLDISFELASEAGYAFVAQLPEIPIRDDMYDGAYSVLTLEHIPDHRRFFTEAARVVRSRGSLALVLNHPFWTAPGSTPITDIDGEVLWRPGDYFGAGSSDVPAGEGTVTFHHRSMAELLSSAADSGWSLEQIVERPHHEFQDQAGIPRLLAGRWRRTA